MVYVSASPCESRWARWPVQPLRLRRLRLHNLWPWLRIRRAGSGSGIRALNSERRISTCNVDHRCVECGARKGMESRFDVGLGRPRRRDSHEGGLRESFYSLRWVDVGDCRTVFALAIAAV